MEKIIESKICTKCSLSFDITDQDLEFYKKVSPKFDGKTYEIPAPTLCPECRQQRRLSFRNQRNVYKRKCSATGETIFSMFKPDDNIKVYNLDFWLSDNWDPLEYAKEFDFTRKFSEQFNELLINVPKPSLHIDQNENSNYSNNSNGQKDCYLVFGGSFNENCYYSDTLSGSVNTVDCLASEKLENSYNCVLCENGYNLLNSYNSLNCKNSNYLIDCNNCDNSIFSKGQINKQYLILNKEYSKEEYNEKKKEIFTNTNVFNAVLKQFNVIKNTFSSKFIIGNNIENSIGDEIFNSKNIYYGFDAIVDSEDIKYSSRIIGGKDIYDLSYFGINTSKILDSMDIGINSSNILFSSDCWNNISNVLYSYECLNNVQNCFGCVGLKNKQYCILNKQYTIEEYNTIVPKIIEHMKTSGEWGEFFPSSISPFGYNETVANEYLPLSKEEILEQGFNYSDYEASFPKVDKVIPADKLPENIVDIPDDILNWAIECEVSKKPFRIISQELEFYRKHNLPIPKKHPDIRHEERMKLRNPRKLFDRKCDKCEVDMKTTYSSDREEIVYCESCYNKEIY